MGHVLLIDPPYKKLENSIKAQNHILVLARTMALGNYFKIMLNHWACYAFLVSIRHINYFHDSDLT